MSHLQAPQRGSFDATTTGTRGRIAQLIGKSGDTLGRTKDGRAIRAVIGQSRAPRNGPTRALRLEWA
jgi:hypothetical protein